MKNKINDYSPIVTVEEYRTILDCPVSDIVCTDYYHIDLDHDPCNPLVYLNIGYDDNPDLDSPIYITPEDALDLSRKLLEFGSMAMNNKLKSSYSKLFLKTLEDNIKENKVSELNVYPVELANQDYFSGCMILDIEYFIKDEDPDLSYSARIVSCNFLTEENKVLSSELEDKLKEEYKIEVIKFDLDKFYELYNPVVEKYKNMFSISEDEFEEYTTNAFDELKTNLQNKK